MTPENKGRALLVFCVAVGIGTGWVVGREHVRREQRTQEAKRPNVLWKKKPR